MHLQIMEHVSRRKQQRRENFVVDLNGMLFPKLKILKIAAYMSYSEPLLRPMPSEVSMPLLEELGLEKIRPEEVGDVVHRLPLLRRLCLLNYRSNLNSIPKLDAPALASLDLGLDAIDPNFDWARAIFDPRRGIAGGLKRLRFMIPSPGRFVIDHCFYASDLPLQDVIHSYGGPGGPTHLLDIGVDPC